MGFQQLDKAELEVSVCNCGWALAINADVYSYMLPRSGRERQRVQPSPESGQLGADGAFRQTGRNQPHSEGQRR